jgi:hypothetical protein
MKTACWRGGVKLRSALAGYLGFGGYSDIGTGPGIRDKDQQPVPVQGIAELYRIKADQGHGIHVIREFSKDPKYRAFRCMPM